MTCKKGLSKSLVALGFAHDLEDPQLSGNTRGSDLISCIISKYVSCMFIRIIIIIFLFNTDTPQNVYK